MISDKTLRALALQFPETSEAPHFENISFKVKKKIFATLNEKTRQVCVKLSLVDQSSFCAYDSEVIHPVPNKWGKQGWTFIDLKKSKKGDAAGCPYHCLLRGGTKIIVKILPGPEKPALNFLPLHTKQYFL